MDYPGIAIAAVSALAYTGLFFFLVGVKPPE